MELSVNFIINKRLTGLFCALIATISWASNYTVNRLIFNNCGAEDLNEWWTSMVRIALCVSVMFPFSLTAKENSWGKFRKEWKNDWKIFLFLGFVLVGEGVLCFAATKYTTAARTSLFTNTAPVFTLLISFLFAREMLNGKKILGIFMGLSGIIIAAVCRGGDAFTAETSTLGGDMLALLAGIFWALFTVFGGKASSKYNGAFCTVIYRLCGLFLLMIPVFSFCNISWNMPWKVWLGLLYSAAIPGGVSVWIWSYAQKHVEPGVLGSFGYLSAICAALFSMIFLEEKISFAFVIAFLLILGGMALVIKPMQGEGVKFDLLKLFRKKKSNFSE